MTNKPSIDDMITLMLDRFHAEGLDWDVEYFMNMALRLGVEIEAERYKYLPKESR